MTSANAPSQFTVAILPLGTISDWQIELTVLVLEGMFGVRTIALSPKEVPPKYFNLKRGRYQASQLRDEFLFSQLPDNAQRIIAIIDGALELDENTECFGLADFNHRIALYSVPNFFKKSDNKTEDRARNNDRSYHLIAHEFGHTLGMKHCAQPGCTMNTAASSDGLCSNCLKWADRELKVMPGSAEERFSLAESCFLHNCLSQAISLYREAIQLAPREPLYRHGLGVALFKLGEKEEGELELVLAASFSDDYPDFYYSFGMNCLRNLPEEAGGYFAKALDASQNPQKTHRLIGQAYREIRHDVEKAGYHYKEYLRLGGNDQDVIDWMISRNQIDPV